MFGCILHDGTQPFVICLLFLGFYTVPGSFRLYLSFPFLVQLVVETNILDTLSLLGEAVSKYTLLT